MTTKLRRWLVDLVMWQAEPFDVSKAQYYEFRRLPKIRIIASKGRAKEGKTNKVVVGWKFHKQI